MIINLGTKTAERLAMECYLESKGIDETIINTLLAMQGNTESAKRFQKAWIMDRFPNAKYQVID